MAWPLCVLGGHRDVETDLQVINAITVIKPGGPLAKADAEEFKGLVIEAEGSTPGRIILDAASVAFVDSRGLEVMLDVTEEMQRDGGVLRVAESNETVREVLELTGIAHDFEFHEDVASALASFEDDQ